MPGELPIARVTDLADVVNMDVAETPGVFPPSEPVSMVEIVN